MADPEPDPEPSEDPRFSETFKNDSWWPYEDMEEAPPPCIWIPAEAAPACDWNPSCEDHGWADARQRNCQRCRGTGIDPEHSHSGVYDDNYMEPPVVEPCTGCQYPPPDQAGYQGPIWPERI